MSVILGIANIIRKAAMGKDITPYEANASKLIDHYGNQDGHVELDDVKAIVENIGEEIGDAAEKVGDFLGEAAGTVGDILDGLF